jgi:hypothetical protein
MPNAGPKKNIGLPGYDTGEPVHFRAREGFPEEDLAHVLPEIE